MAIALIDFEKLDRIAARVAAATPGPWTPMIEGKDHIGGSSCILVDDGGMELDGASDADITFIAHAREDVPYLISEIQKLVAKLGAATEGGGSSLP